MAVVLDPKSRQVIDWNVSHILGQKVVHEALEQRQPDEVGSGLLFHSG